jgi:hypothetical protein
MRARLLIPVVLHCTLCGAASAAGPGGRAAFLFAARDLSFFARAGADGPARLCQPAPRSSWRLGTAPAMSGAAPNALERVRAGARAVTERAQHVSIDTAALEALAARIAADTAARGGAARGGDAGDATGAGWDDGIHFVGAEAPTVQYLLVLDALNFCFWPSEGAWEYADLAGGPPPPPPSY